jgi:hypothetical protein
MNTRHFILHVAVDIWRSFYIYEALKSQKTQHLSTKSFILSVRRFMFEHIIITPAFYAK